MITFPGEGKLRDPENEGVAGCDTWARSATISVARSVSGFALFSANPSQQARKDGFARSIPFWG